MENKLNIKIEPDWMRPYKINALNVICLLVNIIH